MLQAELPVFERVSGQKSKVKELRKNGLVPAVIYGPGIKNQSCTLSEKELKKVFKGDFGTNYILTLKSEVASLNGKRVVVKKLDRDPVKWSLDHVDFYEISLDRPLTVSVPLHFVGVADGVKNSGGILQVIRRSVKIRALPQDLPQAIEVDTSALAINQSLHLSDIKFDSKITVVDSLEFTIVSIVEPEKEEVVVAAAPAEGAAAAAGTGTAAAPAATADAAKK